MLVVKPTRDEKSKSNLKKSLSFGGAMAGFAMGLGLSVSIPLYYHIQALLEEAIEEAFDLSKWLLELARMLGIEPGEDFEAELANGYSLVVDTLNDDGSGTIILKKNGSLSTIIINIDKYGNMTSAGEVTGPGAQEIIDIINGAKDIIGEESSAIDGILDTINQEIDYTSLRIEYASRKIAIEKIITDNLTELESTYTPTGSITDVNDWYDMSMMAHLASKFKVPKTNMTASNPAVWEIDLTSPNGDKPSAVDRGDDPVIFEPWNITNIEEVYGYIDADTEPGLTFIAEKLAEFDAYISWVMKHGTDEEKAAAIEEAGDAIDAAAVDIAAEKDAAADRENDMINGAHEAANDAINEAAANDPSILDKLLVNPQTWMQAYIQTFGYNDLTNDANDKPATTTLRNSMKQRLIQQHMSEGRFDVLDAELKRIMKLNDDKATVKVRVSQIANTYSHEDAVTAVLYAARFVSTQQDGSTESEVLVAHSSVNSINEFDQQSFYAESETEHDMILKLAEIYLSGFSDHTQRQAIINMKKFAFNTPPDDVEEIQDDANGTVFTELANAFAWATRQRGDENLVKQTLAFEMLDSIADRFYFGGKPILFNMAEFEIMMNELDSQRKAAEELEPDWISGIYDNPRTQDESDLLESFKDAQRINIADLVTTATEFITTTNVELKKLHTNGMTFTSFTTATDPSEYMKTLLDFIQMEDYELVVTPEYWPTADQIINNINNSEATRRQALRDIIFFAKADFEFTEPENIDKIEIGAGVGGGLEENTGLNPDEIKEVTDGINEIIVDDTLTVDQLKEVVKYTETIFLVIHDEAEAHAKLKAVLDPVAIIATIPGEIYSGIEKITLLNEWVDHLVTQGVAITTDSIEDYVWHKDQVEVLSAGSIQYKLADGNITSEARGGITSAQYSPSLDIVISGEGYWNGTALSVPYILEKGATETTARAIAGAETQISTSGLWTAPAWNEDLQTLGMHRNVAAANTDGVRLVKMTSPTEGVSQAWSMAAAPSSGVSDDDNASLHFRNTTLSSDGHLYGVTHAGTIFKTTQRLINPDTRAFENVGTTISWTLHYKHATGQGFRGVMAPTLAQWGGEDYVVMSDVQFTDYNQTYGTRVVDGQMTIVSLETGQPWKYLDFPVSFVGLSVDDAGRMIYGLTGTGKIWRIDMENLDDMSAHKEIIDLFELSSSTGIDVSNLTDLFINQSDADTFNGAYPDQATDMNYMGKALGVRGLFYNPSTTEITIYGNDSDLYLPNKSIELIQIFDYLVN